MQEMQLPSLGQEDALEKGMAAHCGDMDISRTQASDLRRQGWWGCPPGWGPGWSLAVKQAAQGRPIPYHRSISLSRSTPPWSEIGWSARFLLHGYFFPCDVIWIHALPSLYGESLLGKSTVDGLWNDFQAIWITNCGKAPQHRPASDFWVPGPIPLVCCL